MKRTGRRQRLEGSESEEKVGVGCGVHNNYNPSILRGVHERVLASSSPSRPRQQHQQGKPAASQAMVSCPRRGQPSLRGCFSSTLVLLPQPLLPPPPSSSSPYSSPSTPTSPTLHQGPSTLSSHSQNASLMDWIEKPSLCLQG